MAPVDDTDDGSEASDSHRATFVYCPDCGTKASNDWSFCRKCNASLSEATTVDDRFVVRQEGTDVDLSEFVGEASGCPKCGHTDADVDAITTTGDDVTRFLDIQGRRFKVVSCTRCGYAEFFKGVGPETAHTLFMR